MARATSWREVWQRRLAAHCLASAAPSERLIDIAGDVCGIHAQIAASAELSLGLRVDGITQSDVRSALWTQRSLVKTYGLRGTLHIFPSHELPMWLAALREPAPGLPRGPRAPQPKSPPPRP